MDLYGWVVVAHVFTVIVAFGAHGTSAFAMFQARRETDRARLGAVLDLSGSSLGVASVALLLAVLLGIVAAVMGGHFGRLWPWAAIVVVVVVFASMTPLGANRMSAVRRALGLPTRDDKGGPPPAPASDADLRAAQAQLRPGLLATIGIVALALLVWLMELKPF
jgi:ABC-type amino acid transport system permease subunit